MDIIDNRDYKVQAFNSIYPCVGVVFEWADDFYMAIEEVQNKDKISYNAVCLSDGALCYFGHEQVLVLKKINLQIY